MPESVIHVLEPRNELLRLFVDSIYVFKKGADKLEFTAYPGINTPVGLLRAAAVSVQDGIICIEHSDTAGHMAMVCNQFSGNVQLRYEQLVDEIAINFKPLGFFSFTQSALQENKVYRFSGWEPYLPDLFAAVFAAADETQQLGHLEQFLLERYRPVAEEGLLLQALALLNDTTKDYKMQEIAAISGLHYKQLYRCFTAYVGCSPAHYRKLLRFRRSVIDKISKGAGAKLTDISYEHDYTDQAYFNKQFKALTGKQPGRFFKEVSSFGNAKVIFKMD